MIKALVEDPAGTHQLLIKLDYGLVGAIKQEQLIDVNRIANVA